MRADHYAAHVQYAREPIHEPSVTVRDSNMRDFIQAELAQALRTEPRPPEEFLDEWLSVPASLGRAEPFAFQREVSHG